MGFGSLYFKLRSITISHELTKVSRRLTQLTKLVGDQTSALSKNKSIFIRANLPTSQDFVARWLANNPIKGSGTTAEEELENDQQYVWQRRSEAMSAYAELKSQVEQEAEDRYDEESDFQLQAYKQEQDEKTTQKATLDDEKAIVDAAIPKEQEHEKSWVDMLFKT